MKKNRKKWNLYVVMICLILMGASIAMADLGSREADNFWFTLEPGGAKHQTGLLKKTEAGAFAIINVKTYENNTNKPFYFRLRSGTNNQEASALVTMAGTGIYSPAYYEDFGRVGYLYYFRIQTDSSSTGEDSYVEGLWMP